jgi:dipeptide/tripeptide permease
MVVEYKDLSRFVQSVNAFFLIFFAQVLKKTNNQRDREKKRWLIRKAA